MIVNDYELKYNNSNKCYKLCKLPRKLNLINSNSSTQGLKDL